MVLDDGQLFLVDCQSTHGTRVTRGGRVEAVQQQFVDPDATVSFGDVSLTVRELMDALRPGVNMANKPLRLVRCRCGVVKPKGRRCPECGEA
jgi:hypothetical protein